jgi:UDP-N-acetylmuramate--alanine ligase
MKQAYHFIGIGGIGMSALAQLLLKDGASVSGSDRADSSILRRLETLGARVAVGHRPENVPESATVVVSDAIKRSNPELAAAEAAGRMVLRRSDLLARMMARRDGIAVSGTHGKTSTTSMIAHILLENGLDPSVVVGGESVDLGGNAHAGSGHLFLAEACEAYDSFLHLAPRIAVITNIEADHLDHHGGFEHVKSSFHQFAGNIRPDGILIASADDPEAAALMASHRGRCMAYGLTAGRLHAKAIRCQGLTSRFSVTDAETGMQQTVSLRVPGLLNVSNALAAFAVGLELGLPPAEIAAALATYSGVRRRFEELGTVRGARIFDDYAHHATEIRATLAAARRAFPRHRVIAVFQPHLYSRTRDFLPDFAAAFDDADTVILTDIYAAREDPIEGISSASVANGIRKRSPGQDVHYIADRRDVPPFLESRLGPDCIVMTMGAGDIRAAAEELVANSREGVAA